MRPELGLQVKIRAQPLPPGTRLPGAPAATSLAIHTSKRSSQHRCHVARRRANRAARHLGPPPRHPRIRNTPPPVHINAIRRNRGQRNSVPVPDHNCRGTDGRSHGRGCTDAPKPCSGSVAPRARQGRPPSGRTLGHGPVEAAAAHLATPIPPPWHHRRKSGKGSPSTLPA